MRRLVYAVLLLCLTGCGVATPAVPPTRTPEARAYPLPHLNSPEYGIQAFLWWHVDNKTAWRDADLVQGLGFGWLKQNFSWRDISGSRGGYDWFRSDWVVKLAEERGLKLLVRLDHQPQWAQADPSSLISNGPPADPVYFGEFCGALATRYAGRIAAYEVWNEPNLARDWGNQRPDPAGYVALLKACYVAIKEADPQAIVVSAGLAPTDQDDASAMPDMAFYQGIYDAGGAPYFDMLGAHAPGYMNPPEMSSDEALADDFLESRVWVFRHVEDVRALMVVNGDGAKQIAVTEMGWTSDPRTDSSYAWYAVTEEQKAEYLVRAYQYAKEHWSPWIGLMSMIYIADPEWTGDHEQYWWSITRPTAPGEPPTLLPAYEALKAMEK